MNITVDFPEVWQTVSHKGRLEDVIYLRGGPFELASLGVFPNQCEGPCAEVMNACQEAEQWQQVLKFLQRMGHWAEVGLIPGRSHKMWGPRLLNWFNAPGYIMIIHDISKHSLTVRPFTVPGIYTFIFTNLANYSNYGHHFAEKYT